MSRTKILLLAISIALVSFLSGAYTIYIWHSNDREKEIATHILAIRIPVERKEISLLSRIAQGIDTASSSETRKHICWLINFKVAGMKEFVRQYSTPYTPNSEDLLKLAWSGDIAIAEGMSVAAKCSSESGSNISVERDASPKSGSRPSP